MTKNMRANRPDQPIPTVGGMPAAHLYQLIEDSPQRVLEDGTLHIELQLCAEHGAMWQAAYERVERELMSEMEECANRHEHEDLLPHRWRAIVIHAMADRAREALGIRDLHPFWC